jgi:hypothetical protein
MRGRLHHARGVARASNWRADGSLRDYLVKHGSWRLPTSTPGADARAAVGGRDARCHRHGQVDPMALVEKARAIPQMEGADLVKVVTCEQSFDWRTLSSTSGEADQREFGIAPQRPLAAGFASRLRPGHQVQHPAAAGLVRLRRHGLSGGRAGRRLCWPLIPTASS